MEAVYVGSLSRKAIASTNLNYPEITGSNPQQPDGAISGSYMATLMLNPTT